MPGIGTDVRVVPGVVLGIKGMTSVGMDVGGLPVVRLNGVAGLDMGIEGSTAVEMDVGGMTGTGIGVTEVLARDSRTIKKCDYYEFNTLVNYYCHAKSESINDTRKTQKNFFL
jgi:hypothetical protein